MRIKVLYLLALILMTATCWPLTAMLLGTRSSGWFIVLGPAGWLVFISLLWVARNGSARVWVVVGLLALASLAAQTYALVGFESFLLSVLVQAVALVIAAMLLYSGLDLYHEWRSVSALKSVGAQVQCTWMGRAATVSLALSTLLLGAILYNLYWLTLWDNTNDPLGYLWIFPPAVAVLFSGVLLSILLPGKTKLAGPLYAALLMTLMIVVSARAQDVD